ncbi:DedA family protein [Ectobacillus antri]|uniref:DedA family protein n=1 Tax=Ectobacillus antri TaxID=2486280 RepID=UPI00362087EF
MYMDFVLELVSKYGYPAMFFTLWLGIVGMPIPDEVIVMTGGFVSSLHILHGVPAFILTYLGVVSGLSLGYVLSFRVGAPILDKLAKKKNIGPYLAKSHALIERHGSYALIFSYFLPVVRHVVPYIVGINRMKFWRYALFSYTTGFVWTFAYFITGFYFGKHIETIGAYVYQYGIYTLIGTACIGIFILVRTKRSVSH